MKRRMKYTLAGIGIAAVLPLSACGGSSASSAGSGSDAPHDVPATVRSALDTGIEGTYALPATTGKTQAGKRVTAVVFGNQSQAGPQFTDAFKAAGAAAGWDVNVVDGKFSTDVYLSAIREAVAQKVDGIVLFVIDCAPIKAGVEEAKAAGIPVVYAEGYDCDTGGGTATGYPLGLYNALAEKDVDYTKFMEATGQLEADSMIAALGGKVDALAVNYPETRATVSITDGFVKEMKKCSGCKSTVYDAVYADFGNALQSKISTQLLKNPSVNAIMGNYDDPVLNGIAAAAATSGRDIYITGEAGYPPMIDLIRQGKADMTVGYDVGMEAWGSIERLNRIFSGDTKMFNIGVGLQVVDAKHGLPAKGETYRAPVDYVSAYKAAWKAS